MQSKKKTIVIVGGGISGLATAYFLQRENEARGLPWVIIGIEGSDVLGGMVQTHQTEGCLVERGPDCFSTERPVLLDLCRELGLESELIETMPAARGLWLREKQQLHELPADFCGLTSMKTSTLLKLPCLSWIGKLRMAFEIFIPRRDWNTEESLGDFIARRFGEEALRRLAQPFLGSIFGADLRQISLKAIFPHWVAMEQKHGSLTRAFLAAKRNPSAVISGGFRTLRGGLSVLVEKMYEIAKVEWHRGVAVQSLFQSGRTWQIACRDGQIYSCDAVCLTVPANRSIALVKDFLPLFAESLSAQPSRSVVLVNALFRKEDWPEKIKGSGIISGLDEDYDLQGASFSSFKFEGRSAENRILVRLFGSPLKTNDNLKKTDSEIQNQIIDDFLKTTGISQKPIWAETVRYENVLPSYNLNYLNWKKNVEQSLTGIKGFYLAGQSYQPGGLSGCVISARNAAEKMINDLLKEEDQNKNLSTQEAVHVSA